ncbi:hypothetical protein EN45_002740 [Penicillium chrysogenum]|uniref:Uncharacterized protein n=1 Tax=Penicillium chrysogenum TaxID=5076 RepID=A0A167V8X3_PENCH|nr:hypothetical protein EN45_002740 [Penicillium chrysogenum]
MSLLCRPLRNTKEKQYFGDRALSTRREAARLVGLYGRLWDSCVSKHIDGEKLEQDNLVLKEAGTHMRKERDGPRIHHDNRKSAVPKRL